LTYLFAPQLLSIYITDSPQAIAYGVTRMAYVALPYFVLGLMDVTTGMLRGLGSSVSPMLISVLGICGIRIVWIYTVFKAYHTPQTLFISYLISWIITFVAQFILFRILYRRRMVRYPEKV